MYIWAALPMIFALINGLICAYRLFRVGKQGALSSAQADHQRNQEAVRSVVRQHASAFLFGSSLVLPPVTLHLLRALDCATVAGARYLRSDKSVSCSSVQYQTFLKADAILLFCYLSLPLLWLVAIRRAIKSGLWR